MSKKNHFVASRHLVQFTDPEQTISSCPIEIYFCHYSTHQSPVFDHKPLCKWGVLVQVLERRLLLLCQLLALEEILLEEGAHLVGNLLGF